jgi:hypothetical protein
MDQIIENTNMYDLFTIEYSELILDIYKEIEEYSNSPYVNFYNKGKYSEFINIIYTNIDYVNSSEILINIKKIDIKHREYEINQEEEYLIDYDL